MKWRYIPFLCGNEPDCIYHPDDDKKKAAEIAKLNIAKTYHTVGILEQFVDTLNLFGKMMPQYYDR